MNLLAELTRRNVIRMAGLYLVGAWLVVQVAATLLPVFGAPAWVMRVLVGVLAVGFFAALVFSWLYEITPEGVKRDEHVRPEASVQTQTGRRMDRLIIVGLGLVVALFAAERFWPRDRTAALPPAAPPAPGVSAPAVPMPPGAGASSQPDAVASAAKSVAVLAFANLSGDAGNDYFSDGISEELLNVLAKVPALKVAARTSSFHFKGKDTPIPEIGRTLGVAYVVEGSVRRAGDRVRITAQLIKADDGFHLWSESYDRELKDVFALQDEIAGIVADKLKLTLGGARRAASEVDPQAYGLVLEGRHYWGLRTAEGFERAEAAYTRALEIDPDFAQAHAGLAETYAIRGWFRWLNSEPGAPPDFERAQMHAERALALDPALAEPHGALGAVHLQLRRFDEARREFGLAFERNPNYASAYQWSGLLYSCEGDPDAAVRELERGRGLDPLSPIVANTWAWVLADAGRFEDALLAVGEAKRLRDGHFPPDYGRSAVLKLWLGRTDDAIAEAREIVRERDTWPRWFADADAIYVLEQAGLHGEAQAHLDWGMARWATDSYLRGMALVGMGRYEEAWAYLPAMPVTPSCRFLFDRRYDPMREDPRMPGLMEKLGIAEGYGRARAYLSRQAAARTPE